MLCILLSQYLRRDSLNFSQGADFLLGQEGCVISIFMIPIVNHYFLVLVLSLPAWPSRPWNDYIKQPMFSNVYAAKTLKTLMKWIVSCLPNYWYINLCQRPFAPLVNCKFFQCALLMIFFSCAFLLDNTNIQFVARRHRHELDVQ